MVEMYLAESLAKSVKLPTEVEDKEYAEEKSDEEIEAALNRLRKLASGEEATEKNS
ncbi:MAG: hypothetical protein QXH51_07455 [Candidatus Bathyarchaeia archaeon]